MFYGVDAHSRLCDTKRKTDFFIVRDARCVSVTPLSRNLKRIDHSEFYQIVTPEIDTGFFQNFARCRLPVSLISFKRAGDRLPKSAVARDPTKQKILAVLAAVAKYYYLN